MAESTRKLATIVSSNIDRFTELSSREKSSALALVARQRELFKTKDLLTEHTKEVNSVQFSHDGKLLLTPSEDGRAIIWHVSDQKLVCILGSFSEVLWPAGSIRIPPA